MDPKNTNSTGKIFNQNNLIEIIRAHSSSIEELVVFSNNVSKLCAEVEKVDKKGVQKTFNSLLRIITDINKYIKRLMSIKIDTALWSKQINDIITTISSLSEIMKAIGSLDVPGFFEQYRNIVIIKEILNHLKKAMKAILKSFDDLYFEIVSHAKVTIKIGMIRSVFESMKRIIDCFEIFSVRRLMQLSVQSFLVKYFVIFILETIKNIFETLNKQADLFEMVKNIMIKLGMFVLVMKFISYIIDEIINFGILKILIFQKIYAAKFKFAVDFVISMIELTKPIEEVTVDLKTVTKNLLFTLILIKLLQYIILSLQALKGIGRFKSKRLISQTKLVLASISDIIDIIDEFSKDDKVEKCNTNLLKIIETINNLTKLFLKIIAIGSLGAVIITNMLWMIVSVLSLKLLIFTLIKCFSKDMSNILTRVKDSLGLTDDIVNVLIKIFAKIISIDHFNEDNLKKMGRLTFATTTLKIFTMILLMMFAKSQPKTYENVLTTLGLIDDIIKKLTSIMAKVIMGGIFVPAFLISIVLLVLAVLALKVFLMLVYTMFGKNRINILGRINKQFNIIKGILGSLLLIFAEALIMAWLAPIFIVAMLLSSLAVLSLKLFLIVLNWALKNVEWGSIFKNMGYLMLFMLLFVVLSFMVMALVFPAIVVYEHAEEVKEFGLILLGVIVYVLVIGALLAVISPYATMMLIGWAVILAMVAMIWLTALMLDHIAKLDLDLNAINDRVNTILEVCENIALSMFTTKEHKAEKTKKSWIKNVIEFVATPYIKIIGAILSVTYLAYLVVSVLFIWMIAAMLEQIVKLDIDEELALKRANTILGICEKISVGMFERQPSPDNPSNKTWIQSVVEFVAQPYMKIIGAILSVAYLAAMVVSVLFIWMIAAMLEQILELNIDENAVISKVDSILNTCVNISSRIFKKDDTKTEPTEKGDILKSIGNFLEEHVGGAFRGISNVIKAVISTGYFAIMLVSVLMVWFLANTLEKLVNLTFTKDAVDSKVDSILLCSDSIITKLNTLQKYKIDWGTLEDIEDVADDLVDIAGSLSEIAEFKIYDLQKAFIQNAADASVYCINAFNNQAAKIKNVGKLANIVECMIDLHESIDFTDGDVRNFKSVTNDSIKLIDKINSADLNKLQTTVNLFNQIARFSESINGNFDQLAQTINDRIAPLLEALQTQIDTLNATVQQTSELTQNALYDANLQSLEIQQGIQPPNLWPIPADQSPEVASEQQRFKERLNKISQTYRADNKWDILYAILTEEGVLTTR